MENNVDNFEVLTSKLIERIKSIFDAQQGYKFDVYSREYLKSITVYNDYRDIRIDLDKIVPADMYLDRTVKLQVRVERDDWFDIVVSVPLDIEGAYSDVLSALDEYFNHRVDSVKKDLNILSICRFNGGDVL